MDRRPWLERTDREMARRGVPARYRRRLIAEWRDHLADLTDEGNDMVATEARMGEPAAVAETAADQYRRARWVRRHPLLTFGITPLPVILLTFVGTFLGGAVLLYAAAWALAGDVDTLSRQDQLRMVLAWHYAIRFLPFILLAAWFTRLYLKSGVNTRWFVVAAAQVLLMAGTLVSVVHASDEPGRSYWALGFAWIGMPAGDGEWVFPYVGAVGWEQVAQIAVPVAVAGLLIVAARRRERLAVA